MSNVTLDAEALYQELLIWVKAICTTETRLVGITSGGAWLADDRRARCRPVDPLSRTRWRRGHGGREGTAREGNEEAVTEWVPLVPRHWRHLLAARRVPTQPISSQPRSSTKS